MQPKVSLELTLFNTTLMIPHIPRNTKTADLSSDRGGVATSSVQ